MYINDRVEVKILFEIGGRINVRQEISVIFAIGNSATKMFARVTFVSGLNFIGDEVGGQMRL